MDQAWLVCEERRELENRVAACVRAIHHNSSDAGVLASEGKSSRSKDFEKLEHDYAVVAARLEALRECLEIHIRIHRCKV